MRIGEVGEYAGDVPFARDLSKKGEVAKGEVPYGEAAAPNGDVGAYGDVGEYPGELGLYCRPPPGEADPEPAPKGLAPKPGK